MGNFRGRKLVISRFCKVSLWNLGACGTSEQATKVFSTKIVFSTNLWRFLPQQFPAMRHMLLYGNRSMNLRMRLPSLPYLGMRLPSLPYLGMRLPYSSLGWLVTRFKGQSLATRLEDKLPKCNYNYVLIANVPLLYCHRLDWLLLVYHIYFLPEQFLPQLNLSGNYTLIRHVTNTEPILGWVTLHVIISLWHHWLPELHAQIRIESMWQKLQIQSSGHG